MEQAGGSLTTSTCVITAQRERRCVRDIINLTLQHANSVIKEQWQNVEVHTHLEMLTLETLEICVCVCVFVCVHDYMKLVSLSILTGL